MSLLDLLTEGTTGGLIGLFGAILQKALSIWTAHQDIASKKIDYAHELEMAKLNLDAKAAELASQNKQIENTNEAQTQQKSYDLDLGNPSQWVINFQAFIRPFLTMFFVVLVSLIFFVVDLSLKENIVSNILSYTGLTVGWWFGCRFPQTKMTTK